MTTARTHIDAIARLLGEFGDSGVELVEHHYTSSELGSFTLVLARGHDQAKFIWDGRESVLTVSFAKVTKGAAAPAWVHDAHISLPKGDGLYEEIYSEVERAYAT